MVTTSRRVLPKIGFGFDVLNIDTAESPLADATRPLIELYFEGKIPNVITRLETRSATPDDLIEVRWGCTILSAAAEDGNYTIVRLLLENSAFQSIPDYEWAPAFGAAKLDHLSIVQLLWATIPDLCDVREPHDGNSLLHVAASHKAEYVLRWLLQRVDTVDIFNHVKTVLHRYTWPQGFILRPFLFSFVPVLTSTSKPRHYPITAISDSSQDGTSPLHLVVNNSAVPSVVLTALLVAGADLEATDKNGRRPVDVCQDGNVAKFLEKEAQFRERYPLHFMARSGRCKPVLSWINDTLGCNGSSEAVYSVKVDNVARERDLTTDDGLTVLMYAAKALDYTTQDQALECLLPYCSNETILLVDSDGRTALDYLLNKKLVCIDSTANGSNNALLRSANNNWNELQTLLRSHPHTPSINEYDDLGYAVLHRVAQCGHVPTLELLLQQTKLNVNLRTASDGGDVAVNLAAKANHVDCVRLLLQAGAETALPQGITKDAISKRRAIATPSQKLRYDRWELVQEYPSYATAGLLNIQAAEDAIKMKQGALQVAMRTVQSEHVLKALFAKTSDIDAQDNMGHTALMMAAQAGHISNVRFLLSEGVDADVDLQDKTGKTALMYAATAGHDEVVDMLVKALADLTIMDANGCTVISHLNEWVHANCIHGRVNPSSPQARILDSLRKESRMRATSHEYKEKLALSMTSLTTEEVFSGNGFAKALACSINLGQTFLNDCVQLDRHEAQFFNLDLAYGKQSSYSALHAVLNVRSGDPDYVFLAKKACLEHIVMYRLLAIKWELFGQRKYIEQLLMDLLLLLAMTTSSVLFQDEEPPIVVCYFGLATMIFVAVAFGVVQVLRPALLWRLARFSYDRRLHMDPEMVIPDLWGRKAFVRRCLGFLVLALTGAGVVPMAMGLRQLNEETWFPPLCHGVLGLTAMYFIANEFKELRHIGRKYLSSRMNCAQLLIYFLILVVFVPIKFGFIDATFELHVILGSFLSLALWVLSLQFLEVVPSASYLLPMFADLFGDIYNFFIVFGIFQVGLTITFYQLFRRQPEDTAFSSPGQSFLTTYFVMFGQVPLDSLRVFADSSSAASEVMYVATTVLIMMHSAVVVVILLNVLLALMNQTVTSGLEKAKSQALASYASCILRLEGAMNLSEDETLELTHLPCPDGHRVLNPIFTERVPKAVLWLSNEQTEALLASAADRRLWNDVMQTLDDAIDWEVNYLVGALNHTAHFTTMDVVAVFADELRIIEMARSHLKVAVNDARNCRGQYKHETLSKLRARVAKELAKLKEKMMATWKPKSTKDTNTNHSQCVLLFELAQRSSLEALLGKSIACISTAVESTLAANRDKESIETDATVRPETMLETDVAALKELFAVQVKDVASLKEFVASHANGVDIQTKDIASQAKDLATLTKEVATMTATLDVMKNLLMRLKSESNTATALRCN
ncbi:ankyrin repeat protein [Achlya hypogyna]|uniref:Ankyrin repeat protein n=1 Tax=Achlya hypogyna TaxID=1202772 RepID=A0A1V9YEA5_ACHHY|nr:ankyrin repeat protein [Achlya hypogyna]